MAVAGLGRQHGFGPVSFCASRSSADLFILAWIDLSPHVTLLSTSSNERATTYFAGFSPTASALKWASPH